MNNLYVTITWLTRTYILVALMVVMIIGAVYLYYKSFKAGRESLNVLSKSESGRKVLQIRDIGAIIILIIAAIMIYMYIKRFY